MKAFLIALLLYMSFIVSLAAQQHDKVYSIFEKENRKSLNVSQQLEGFSKAITKAKQLKDTIHLAKAYQHKGFIFSKQKQLDSTLWYYKKAIVLQKQVDPEEAIASASYIASLYRKNDSLPKAIIYYEEALLLSKQLQDTTKLLRSARFLAHLQMKIDMLQDSEATCMQALQYVNNQQTNTKYQNDYLGLYNQLGIIYKNRGNYNEALQYYEKAASFPLSISEQTTLTNNIGNIYLKQQQYAKAKDNFTTVYKHAIRVKDTAQIARALNNLGVSLYETQQHEAIDTLQKSLALRKAIHYELGMYSSNYYLAKAYAQFGDAKAIKHAKEAYNIAKNLNLPDEQLESLALLITLGLNNYAPTYITLKDSLETAHRETTHQYLALKYNYQQEKEKAQESAIKLLESDIARQKESKQKQLWQYTVVATLLLFVLVVIILYQRHRSKTLQQIYATENRIAKQVHDEIANDMYHAMNALQQPQFNKNGLLHQLDSLYKKTRNIAKANGSIALQEDFTTTLKSMLASYKKEHILLFTTGYTSVAWDQLPKEKQIVIYRVLQELLTNMDKYSKATWVKLLFEKKGKKIHITYTDNGVGTILKHKSGLLNTENRMASIGGSITFETQPKNGFTAYIVL